jgi:hypothetical protein
MHQHTSSRCTSEKQRPSFFRHLSTSKPGGRRSCAFWIRPSISCSPNDDFVGRSNKSLRARFLNDFSMRSSPSRGLTPLKRTSKKRTPDLLFGLANYSLGRQHHASTFNHPFGNGQSYGRAFGKDNKKRRINVTSIVSVDAFDMVKVPLEVAHIHPCSDVAILG